jgi:hypothetical protein
MRKYKITYLIESNDVATDCEYIIQAQNILDALIKFSNLKYIIKRVTDINELPYNHETT